MAENKNTTENNKNSTIPENNEQLLERIMEKTQDEFLDESEESSENTEDIKDTEETEGKEEQGEQAESTEDTENEPEEMKEKSAKKKKKSIYNRILSYLSGFTGSIKAVAIAVVILVIVASGIFVAVNSGNIKIGESQASFSQEYSMSSQAQFYSCNNSIFFSSKDGMSLLDKKGNTVWTDTFSMTTPVMLSDGEYTAVADKGAKTMNVYNLKGKAYTVNTEGVITTFAINPLGYSVVMCQSSGENDYTAFCYSPDGKVAFKGSYVAKDGLPASIDISDDGRIIGISFINISRIKIKSKVNFYFVNTEDAKTTDNSDAIFSGVEMDNEVAAIVHFMWKDRLDVMQWMHIANQIYGDSTQMVVHGISMGGATTMMVSGEAQPYFVKCFVEDCGYTSVWDEFSHELKSSFHLPSFPLMNTTSWLCQKKYGWNFEEASSLNQVKKSHLPMFFIHGDKDTYVPTWMVYPLYEAKSAPKQLWIVPGAAHAVSYKENKEEYTRKVKEFTDRYIH